MITRHNPPQLHRPPGYHHVTLVEPGSMAYLAGQCPLDAAGAIPAERSAQVDQVVANAEIALAAAGCTAADVVRCVIYVVSGESTVLAEVWQQLRDSRLGPALQSASTLLGVAALGFAGQLLEIDLTARVPG